MWRGTTSHTYHTFVSVSSWEGHSLKQKQESEEKSWALLDGGRLGFHGNCRVRSPGCCSASVGTHYATSHLSVSICLSLCSSVAFTPALCPCAAPSSPSFLLFLLWSIEEGGVRGVERWITTVDGEGRQYWLMGRHRLRAQRQVVLDICPFAHIWGDEVI